MAHERVIIDWKPLRFLPWVECQVSGVFLDTNPNIPLDLLPPLRRYRWRKLSRSPKTERKLAWIAIIIASIFLAAPFIYLAIEG